MNNDTIDPIEVSTGKTRADARLAAKLLANKSIPVVETDPTRQVLRAQKRQAGKNLRRHTNEEVLGKNKQRSRSALPLNRAGRRHFTSNRADPKFRLAVIQHMAGTA